MPIYDKRAKTERLFSEKLMVAIPSDHPFANKEAVPVSDLKSERFILMKEGHYLGDQVLDFCTRRDFRPNILCRNAQSWQPGWLRVLSTVPPLPFIVTSERAWGNRELKAHFSLAETRAMLMGIRGETGGGFAFSALLW
jgi:DNA-binding transcriptional LysR family regulator